MAGVFAASVAACALIQHMPRDSFVRMLVYQSPYFIMQGIAVAIVAQAKELTRLDRSLMVLLAASAMQFLSKPFLFRAFGGTGATPSDYLTTHYAMFSQSMGTVFAIAIALMMLVIVMRNALVAATERSESDPLSGLLNRGGFESRARSALGEAARNGGWVSLVLADLDHFKSINDSYGHAAGDKLITTFAAFLRSLTPGHHVAGRIGGEEFAVLLTGTRLAAARLFAEAARAGCSTLTVEGVPDSRRLSASFGVAELVAGEDIVDLLARADKALYIAKRSGRDCVRIAPPRDTWKADGSGKVIGIG
jgi:diguanylate cyclase (GGDEF)-like protein